MRVRVCGSLLPELAGSSPILPSPKLSVSFFNPAVAGRCCRAAGKKGGEWVYVTHGVAPSADVVAAIKSALPASCPDSTAPAASSSYAAAAACLTLRYEPFILHVECRDVAAASRLLQVRGPRCLVASSGLF